MNIAELKSSDYLIFEAISGSMAYGTNRPDSDTDLRGIFRLPKDQKLTLLDYSKEIADDTQDVKYYELEKFMRLAAECNPSILELLWLPQDCIQFKNPIMDKLLENRDLFVSKKAYHTFNGYAYSMLQKAQSKNRFVNNPKAKERPTREDFCFFIPIRDVENYPFDFSEEMIKQMEMFPARPIHIKAIDLDLSKFHCARLEQSSHMYRLYYYGDAAKGVFRGSDMLSTESIPISDESTHFVGYLTYNQDLYEKNLRDWKSYWEWMNNRNEARWIDQEKGIFQYDRKNAMHCVRLILSGKNILKYGEPIVRFTGAPLQFLKKIREGEIEYSALIEIIDIEIKNLEELNNSSTLPWGCDMVKIDKLYKELMEM